MRNNGDGTFSECIVIGDNFTGARSAHAEDVDGDGDFDILVAAKYSHQIALWDNDGDQNFTKNIIDDGFEGATNVFSADINQDGNKDILAVAVYANEVAWWQNKGNGQFVRFVIGENFKGATFVYAEDIDADGYKDVLVPAVFDNQIGLWISKPMHTPAGTFVSPIVERLENSELETASWHDPHSAEDFYTVSGPPINPLHNAHAIFQYRVFFETDSLLITPRLNQVITILCGHIPTLTGNL